MTSYAKITDFASKDALLTGNPAKIVKGVEIDDEFNAIATADATSVKGPIGATVDNTVARWDGTTGRAVQGSGVTISDADVVTASGFTGPHNGTVGATTPSIGAFTTLSASGGVSIPQAINNDPAITMTGSGAYNSRLNMNGSSVGGVINVQSGGNLFAQIAGTTIGAFSSTGLAVTGALSATVADTAFAQKLAGATTKFRFRPYVDATNGAILDVSNAAENAYGVLSIIGSTIRLATGSGTLAATLDNAGNLGLGVTPSAWGASYKALDISGYGAITASSTDAQLVGNSYYNGTTWIAKATGAASKVNVTGNGAYLQTAPSVTSGASYSFVNSLSVTNGGTLALEGATSAAGTGIAFPATQLASSNANTLDDYEEGTFTPVVYGSSSGGAGTYTTQIGKYTKIGRLVHIEVSAAWTAHSGTGNLLFGTLPFATAANHNAIASVYANNLTITGVPVLALDTNASVGTFYALNNGTASALAIDSAATLIFSCTYHV